MAVIAGLTNSFKEQLLEGVHDLTTDTMKIALYTEDADITPATTVYSATNEVSSAASTVTRTCTWTVGTSVDIDSPGVTSGITLGTSVFGFFTILDGTVVKALTDTDTIEISPASVGVGSSIELTFGDYIAGGNILVSNGISQSGSTFFIDFADTVWLSASFTTRGALIYNSTQSNKSIAVLDFGLAISPSASTFTVKFPTADVNDAIIRIK